MCISPRFLPAGLLAAALCVGAALLPARASDHADPMSLNVFKVQEMPEANITDLHAFVVDGKGHRITEAGRLGEGDQLIISLCMRRALAPQLIQGLKLDGFKFRVHLDLHPPVRFFDETKTREGTDFAEALAQLNAEVNIKAVALAEARQKGDQALITAAMAESGTALARRGTLLANQQADRSSQALYGGIFTQPDAIAETALLEFELDLDSAAAGENAQALLTGFRIEGIPGEINHLPEGTQADKVLRVPKSVLKPGAINIQSGVFDDPFIFPRFFRRNIVAVVTSIPLASLPPSVRQGPIVLWATTHKDKQIDHVGRSLRTQLPRFGYLNGRDPAEHVSTIARVHDRPTLMENIEATFIAPLFAHRYYDSAPDVMVYDLRKPARFPNGRAFEDDVAATLAAAGETLLVELSYSESRQFPRATMNDKPFQLEFPYLAPRWSMAEVASQAHPGATMELAVNTPAGPVTQTVLRPFAADSAAIAPLNFAPSSWMTLWLLEMLPIGALVLGLLFVLRSKLARIVFLAVGLAALYVLMPVIAPALPSTDPAAMAQPAGKFMSLLVGAGFLAVLAIAFLIALGRYFAAKWPPTPPQRYPKGVQEITGADSQPSTYNEIHKALFDPGANGQYYQVWGEPGQAPLPVYKQTFASISQGLLRIGTDWAMLRAARRTVRSHADLRWGQDRKGFRRLVHPIGICLAGTWKIDAGLPNSYTGYFAPGKTGRVIARYSLGGNEPRNGHDRSLGLVGKLFPPADADGKPTPRATFITQEDLGGALTRSIAEVKLTNSPPVTLFKRGSGLPAFLVVILSLLRADKQPAERQLYEVAELEKSADVPTNAPRFMRLSLVRRAGLGDPGEADFRDEILGAIYDRADAAKKRELSFDIEVSDEGERTLFQKVKGQKWRRIGSLSFEEAAASYNGDFVVHFHHPVWRNNRNDPGSVARTDLRPEKAPRPAVIVSKTDELLPSV